MCNTGAHASVPVAYVENVLSPVVLADPAGGSLPMPVPVCMCYGSWGSRFMVTDYDLSRDQPLNLYVQSDIETAHTQ